MKKNIDLDFVMGVSDTLQQVSDLWTAYPAFPDQCNSSL